MIHLVLDILNLEDFVLMHSNGTGKEYLREKSITHETLSEYSKYVNSFKHLFRENFTPLHKGCE